MDRLALVQRVFRDVFDNEELKLTPAMTQSDVDGWDSVAQVKVLLALESELGIRFETEEVSAIRSVGDLLAAIEAHG